MIDPQIMQDSLMLLSVIALGLVPILSAIGTYNIGRVFLADAHRPRNTFVRRMFMSGIFVTLTGFFISSLSVAYVMSYINQQNDPATFSGLIFAWLLIGVMLQPFINWRAVKRLNGSVIHIGDEETDFQRDDRRAGDHRRSVLKGE